MKTAHFALILALILTANSALCAGIQIPGYETIHFKAGKIQQDVFFRNPENNPCCFRMSITLAGGVPLWIADDVLYPGEVFTKIDLEQELKPEIYRNACNNRSKIMKQNEKQKILWKKGERKYH